VAKRPGLAFNSNLSKSKFKAMQINQNQITPQMWANIETKDGINEQVQKFRYRSFYERHKGAAAAAGAFGTAFLGLLSIGCAIMYVSEKIALAVGNYIIAALIAAIILVALELLKTYALSGLFESFYYEKLHKGTGKWAAGLAVGCVVLIAISAALSVLGAESYTLQSADKSKEITLQGFAKVDSARAVFDAKILALENTIKEIESGKVDRWGKMLTKSENKQILNLQTRIADIEADKKAAISEQKTGTSTAISETKTSAMSAATVGGLIAFFNEAAIIFCAWFVWFFAFKVANEERLKAETPAAGGKAPANEDNHVSIENLTNNTAPNNGEKKGIGFSFGTKVAPTDAAKASPTDAGKASTVKAPAAEPTPLKAPTNEPVKVAPAVKPLPLKADAGKASTVVMDEPSTVEPAPLKAPANEPTAGKASTVKQCLNCGKEFTSNRYNAKYCPLPKDVCRVAFWEAETGKKVILGK